MKKICTAVALQFSLTALAVVDHPNVLSLNGTGYHEDDWLSIGSEVRANDGLVMDSKDKFVVSPHYAEPIRKVVLRVKCSVAAPTRWLRIRPFVDGMEVGTDVWDCAVTSVEKEKEFEYVSFDFDEADKVTAFRLGVEGSSGTWTVGDVFVFHGARTADEDETLVRFARQLPTPEKLRASELELDRMTLVADAVAGAVGYRFAVELLTGVPLTEYREDFSTEAGELSTGWTLASSQNAKLETYTGSGYFDPDAANKVALKVSRDTASGGAVLVAIDSPTCEAPISTCSFSCRVNVTSPTDDVFRVWGRAKGSSEWTELAALVPTSTVRTNVTVAVDVLSDIVQARFSVESKDPSRFATAALDSLRVVFGGDEKRTPVALPADICEHAECAVSNLTTGRYAVKVQSVGRTEGDDACRDSSWSSELRVDLNWALIVVEPPKVGQLAVAGDKLTVRWDPVEGAEHYLVDVVPTDNPDAPVVRSAKTTETKLVVTVPSIGDYAVRVTAVSPCGKSTATSAAVEGTVALDGVENVKAEATDRQTIEASWDLVALAESYQATIVRIGGDMETEIPDFSGLPERWPDGWSHNPYDTGTYAGPAHKMQAFDSWIESRTYDKPITVVRYRFKSHVESAAHSNDVAQTWLVVKGETAGGVWLELFRHQMKTATQTFAEKIPAETDIRRLRFEIDYQAGDRQYRDALNVEFKALSIVVGEETRTEVATVGTTDKSAVFGGLDPSGRYQVTVAPQPSEDPELAAASAVIDLALERFRATGAVSIGGLKDGLYAEDFSSLSNQTTDVKVRKAAVDYWQFLKGSGTAEDLLYTEGTNRTTGGVYVFGGGVGEPEARQLGTLATSSFGCSVGLAFRNDLGYPVAIGALSFDTVQRSFRSKTASYVLEWTMTDGAAGIGAESVWHPIPISETAPYANQPPDGQADYRQSQTLTDVLPKEKIPSGGVLILRWRHEKVGSGPMMAIDNVKVEFRTSQQGMMMIVR